MKVEKLDHVHVYVKDLEKAKGFFSRLLSTNFSPDFAEEEDMKVRTSLTPLGLELIEPTSPDSAVAKIIERRGEGLAALSFKVTDIEQAIAELESQGLRLIAKVEFGNIKEAQFHPGDAHGVMLELCEYEEQHGAALAALGG